MTTQVPTFITEEECREILMNEKDFPLSEGYTLTIHEDKGKDPYIYMAKSPHIDIHVIYSDIVPIIDCIGCQKLVPKFHSISEEYEWTMRDIPDHYQIPPYNDILVRHIGIDYCIYIGDSIVHTTDHRVHEINEWIMDLTEDTKYTIDNFLKLKDIPYDPNYYYAYDSKLDAHIWIGEDEIYTVPEMDASTKGMYILEREDNIPYEIGVQIAKEYPVQVRNTSLCTLIVKDDRVIFIYDHNKYTNTVLYDLRIHPYFSSIPAKKILNGIDLMISERRDNFYSRYEKEDVCNKQCIKQLLNLSHWYLYESKNNCKPFSWLKRQESDDTLYHVNRVKLGNPYFLRDLSLDQKVENMLKEMNIKYIRVKYPITVSKHGNLLDIEASEDIPISLIKEKYMVYEHEGGCCSQRDCEGYDLELDAFILAPK